jgi:hypothetical protein
MQHILSRYPGRFLNGLQHRLRIRGALPQLGPIPLAQTRSDDGSVSASSNVGMRGCHMTATRGLTARSYENFPIGGFARSENSNG